MLLYAVEAMSLTNTEKLRLSSPFNPSMSKGGGKITPRTTFFATILETLGIGGCALATFPKYKLATRWRFQTISDTYQKCNMAAGKPDML